MSLPADPVLLSVSVVFAREVSAWSIPLLLPAGASVGDALASVNGDARYAGVAAQIAGLAIFGRLVNEDTPLHDGDRVELLRALVADPKQARRERAVESKRRA